MRATTSQLTLFLAARPTSMWMADLFTITLLSGTVLRYASGDIPVSFNGITWQNVGPNITRTKWGVKYTTDVSTMDITLSSSGSDYAGGNIKTMLQNGAFDGAVIQLDRAIGTFPGLPLGLVTLFAGPCGQIEMGALTAKITVKSWLVLLQQFMPRNTYQTACIHSLYDAGCTLSRAAFTATNTVYGVSPNTIEFAGNWLLPGGATAPVANLLGGTMTITSGAAAGAKRSVAALYAAAMPFTSGAGSLTFIYPLPQLPAVGDTLTCSYGCDKSPGTCLGRFNNLQHIRLFPYIPPPEQGI